MDIVKSYESRFQKVISDLKEELASLRVGRATPVLVEGIEVEVYGVRSSVKSLAAVAAPDYRTIVIQPWDRANLEAIERAIRNSPQGYSPIVEQSVIRIQLAALTEEKRRELKKIVGQKAEGARIKIRQIRDDLWSKIQDQARNKDISEDEKFRLKDKMEDLTKDLGEEIKQLEKKKEGELLAI